MDWKSGRVLIVVGGTLISLIVIASVLLVGVLFNPASSGQNFLLQLIQRNDDAVLEYLSPEFRQVVRENCPVSSPAACFWERIPESWGQLEAIRFERRSPDDQNELFHVTWSGLESPVSIVLLTGRIDGSYLIYGWRGFVVGADTALDDALLLGLRQDAELSAAPQA